MCQTEGSPDCLPCLPPYFTLLQESVLRIIINLTTNLLFFLSSNLTNHIQVFRMLVDQPTLPSLRHFNITFKINEQRISVQDYLFEVSNEKRISCSKADSQAYFSEVMTYLQFPIHSTHGDTLQVNCQVKIDSLFLIFQ